MTYEYDMAGNRLEKHDLLGEIDTYYTYDVSDPEEFDSQGNRLMYEERQDGSQQVIEKRWYRYDLRGRADYVTREIAGDLEPQTNAQFYRGTRLWYDARGHVWIAVSERWKVVSSQPTDCTALAAMEYRYTSGRARYMVRKLDPDTLLPVGGTAYEGQWHDYDGDAIYGDYTIDYDDQQQPPALVVTDVMAHEPGLAQYAHAAADLHHLHGNVIGTTEVLTDDSGALADRRVYTAFGEPIYLAQSPPAGARYGYAGAWGYQAASGETCDLGGEEVFCDPLAELGWLHLGERYYDPSSGRLVQRDPIGIRGELNTYSYVLANPNTTVDPKGLTSLVTPFPGVPPPPGVTPGFGFRRDIDYLDAFSIAHFCIPLYLSSKTGKGGIPPLVIGIVAFEYVEPGLRRIDPSLYYETQENVTGDIIIGLIGVFIGPLLFFCKIGARRPRQRRQ